MLQLHGHSNTNELEAGSTKVVTEIFSRER